MSINNIPDKLVIFSKLYGKEVKAIEKNVFCNKRIKEINIPHEVMEIDMNIFRFCCAFESVTILKSITTFGYYTFGHCTYFTEITLPNIIIKIHMIIQRKKMI